MGIYRHYMDLVRVKGKEGSFELWNIDGAWHVLKPGGIRLWDGIGVYKRLCLEGTLEECLHCVTGDVVSPAAVRIA